MPKHSKQNAPKQKPVIVQKGQVEIEGTLLERCHKMRIVFDEVMRQNHSPIAGPLKMRYDHDGVFHGITSMVAELAQEVEDVKEAVKALNQIILENSEELPPNLKLVKEETEEAKTPSLIVQG